jgi:EAL domain-containing protein (putative c-di-GMP-specific phosphodiesterase class I)/GGDEF domain-containing protein
MKIINELIANTDWAIDMKIVIGVGGILFMLLFFRLIKLKAKGSMENAESALFKKNCQTAEDTVIVVDRTYHVVFANISAKIIYPFKQNQNLKEVTRKAFRYFDPKANTWIPLDELIHRHRKRKAENATLFSNLQLDEEGLSQVQVKIDSIHSKEKQHLDIITVRDISCEKRLLKQHNTNLLSGLPNWYQALADISAKISSSTPRTRFAVIILELDNVVGLRGMFGYEEIERIFSHSANVLREMESDFKIKGYHLSYSTFMLLLEEPENEEMIHLAVKHFTALLEQTKIVAQENYKLTFSVGVSLFPRYGTVYELLNSAFAAVAKAQEQGAGHIIISQENKLYRSDMTLTLSREIKEGLKKREFKLYFQPIFDSKTLHPTGAEVLLRWEHSEGMRHPGMFIPFAEKSGLIVDIGYYVLEEALKMLTQWHHSGFPPIVLNLNLSFRELESLEFMNHLKQTFYRYDPGASRIKYEITEYAAMHNPSLTREHLEILHQLGIMVALDDFGTGYSSFSHLAEFPIDTLKIDKSFVDNMVQDRSKQHIISTITKLGHSLGMNLVAEGIETRDQAKLLRQMGVDLFQGYYFAKPMPQLEFQYFLRHPKEQEVIV